MNKILVINGPNLNMLGKREPHVYGSSTLTDIEDLMRVRATALTCDLEFFQSNHEGAIIDRLHACFGNVDAVIINAGGYTHTSIALRDAIAAISPTPVIEVHITNIFGRTDTSGRDISIMAPVCVGVIAGFGPISYILALEAAALLPGRPQGRIKPDAP